MKQAIAGVTPASTQEATVMMTWPSVARYGLGRLLGRGFANQTGFYIFTVGNFFALLMIPVAIPLYFFRLFPSFAGVGVHGSLYKLTNRRVIELRPEVNFRDRFPFLEFKFDAEVKSIELDRFDTIEIRQRPGQHWYDAGDLVFLRDNIEAFRLEGVSRPAAFRQTCVKSRASFVGVKQALDREAVRA